MNYDGLAYRLFGGHTYRKRSKYAELEAALKKANTYVPVEIYEARAWLSSCLAGLLVAAIVTALAYYQAERLATILQGAIDYVIARGLSVPALSALSPYFPGNPAVLMALAALLTFLIIFLITRAAYGYYPGYKAAMRESDINSMLPYAMTFMYAMSQGGMNPMQAFRSLGEHSEVYGEMSREAASVVRGVDLLGYDLISSIKNVAATTPSEPARNFFESSVSVMESGGDYTKFLYSRIRQSREVMDREQTSLLEILGLLAEVYVTALVAGPLFIMIVMVVIGMMGGSNILLMQALVYLMLPVASLLFVGVMFFLGLIARGEKFAVQARELDAFSDVGVAGTTEAPKPYDEGWRYRLRKFRESPTASLLQKPEIVLYASIPIAVVVCAWFALGRLGTQDIMAWIDDLLIAGFVIGLVPYALAWEYRQYRIRKIDNQIPEFLKRLASVNDSGLTLEKAIRTLVKSNLGVLNTEIRRIIMDLEWGAGVRDALVRFEYRVNTFSVRRVVTLIVKASETAGNIKDTLQIAAEDADSSNNLREQRLADMLVYVAVIYISFLVFVYVAYVLSTTFLTAVSPSVAEQAGALGGSLQLLPASYIAQVGTIKTLLYHSVLLEGLFSGLIAGAMGEGSLRSGLKHSIIMVLIAFVAFLLFI